MRKLMITAALLVAAPALLAQDAAPAPVPKGEAKPLQAVAMEVAGTVQWRPTPKDAWRDLKVGDLLDAGAEIRTGRESNATLRVGMNATTRIERQTRIAISELTQEGGKLRTRLAMQLGKADVKVDKVGLDNDFEVSTPTATLAVKGTMARIWWDAIHGFRAEGLTSNQLRSVELRYMQGLLAWLTSDDASEEGATLPAFEKYGKTFFILLKAALDDGFLPGFEQIPPRVMETIAQDHDLKTLRQSRGEVPRGEPPTDGQGQAGTPSGFCPCE